MDKTATLHMDHSELVLLLQLLTAEHGRILARPRHTDEDREHLVKYGEQITLVRKRLARARLDLIARMNDADAERASAFIF